MPFLLMFVSLLVFLVPLVEVFVAQEVDWIEDIPSIVFKTSELCTLASKDDSASLVCLDVAL